MLKVGWIIWISVQWFVQSRVNAEVHCTVDDYGSFIADPKACEKFYFCDHTGAATSVYCPQGMWFNTKKGICDLPSNVNCVIQDDDNSPFDEEPADCPTHDTTFVTFLPSKVNCRHYYLCYHGRAFKQECITELHWNPKKNRCDFPSKAKCSIQPPKPRCPAHGKDLIPHPSECDYFYYCINGYVSLQQCPFYHHWDVETQSCQWKNRAKCISDPEDDSVKYKSSSKKMKKRRQQIN